MEIFDLLTSLIMNGPVYIVNGLLAVAYGIAGALPAIVSIVVAGALMLTVDAEVQGQASNRPLRPGRGEMQINSNTSQILTGATLVLWLIAQLGMGAPVPWIGAAMWLAGFVAVLLSATQRPGLSQGIRAGLATYALAVIMSRVYMTYAAQVTPEQWAALIGSADAAATIIANTRGNTTTIIVWALWLVVPVGYFSMLAQQVLQNPVSLTSPMATAEATIRALRSRGGA